MNLRLLDEVDVLEKGSLLRALLTLEEETAHLLRRKAFKFSDLEPVKDELTECGDTFR